MTWEPGASIDEALDGAMDIHKTMRSRPLWERLPPRALTAREIAAVLPSEAANGGIKVSAYGWVVEGEELEESPFVAFVVRSRSFHHLHCSERDGWQRVETARGDGLGYGTSREVLHVAADLLDADTEMITEIATADPHGLDAAFDAERRAARRREDSGPHTEFDELLEDEAADLRGSLYAERIESETVDEDDLKEPIDVPADTVPEAEVEQAKRDATRIYETAEWRAGYGLENVSVEAPHPELEGTGYEGVNADVSFEDPIAEVGLMTYPVEGDTATAVDRFDAAPGDTYDLGMLREGDDLVARVLDRDGQVVAEARLEGLFDVGLTARAEAEQFVEEDLADRLREINSLSLNVGDNDI